MSGGRARRARAAHRPRPLTAPPVSSDVGVGVLGTTGAAGLALVASAGGAGGVAGVTGAGSGAPPQARRRSGSAAIGAERRGRMRAGRNGGRPAGSRRTESRRRRSTATRRAARSTSRGTRSTPRSRSGERSRCGSYTAAACRRGPCLLRRRTRSPRGSPSPSRTASGRSGGPPGRPSTASRPSRPRTQGRSGDRRTPRHRRCRSPSTRTPRRTCRCRGREYRRPGRIRPAARTTRRPGSPGPCDNLRSGTRPRLHCPCLRRRTRPRHHPDRPRRPRSSRRTRRSARACSTSTRRGRGRSTRTSRTCEVRPGEQRSSEARRSACVSRDSTTFYVASHRRSSLALWTDFLQDRAVLGLAPRRLDVTSRKRSCVC